MTRFRSLPTEIDAIQWLGDWDVVKEFLGEPASGVLIPPPVPSRATAAAELWVAKSDAWVDLPVGHWIIREPDDPAAYYPCDPHVFEKRWESIPPCAFKDCTLTREEHLPPLARLEDIDHTYRPKTT